MTQSRRTGVILRLALLGLLLGLFGLSYQFRDWLDIEASAQSIRDFVARAGWWGPVIYVLLFLFRSALLIPSVILLTAGGVCFGVLGGTVFGALGLTFSAFVKLLIAHLAGRDRLIALLSGSARRRLATLNRGAGPGILVLATAYPVGPAEILHVAAILAGMAMAPFLTTIGIGSLIRAGSFSLFGDALIEGEGLAWAAGALVALSIAPLLVPAWRAWLVAQLRNVR